MTVRYTRVGGCPISKYPKDLFLVDLLVLHAAQVLNQISFPGFWLLLLRGETHWQ